MPCLLLQRVCVAINRFFGGRMFGILFIYVLVCFVSRFDSHIRVCLYCYRCQCKERRVSRGENLVTWKCIEPAQ
jgi:hypothetical protein